MISPATAPSSTPEQELAWLHALIAFDRTHGWLRDSPDEQGRALALAYTLQALGARHTRDLGESFYLVLDPTVDHPEPKPVSLWAYGFEVDTRQGPVFVGTRGEASSREEECTMAQMLLGARPDQVRSRPWEDQRRAFASLEQARRFYSRETFTTLTRLVGEGAAHIRATALESALTVEPHANKQAPRL